VVRLYAGMYVRLREARQETECEGAAEVQRWESRVQ
jgi:hypothetical protein